MARTDEYRSLSEIYEDVERAVGEGTLTCWACGTCCDFEKAGHQLWASRLEVEYMVAAASGPVVTQGNVCPYRGEDGKCANRQGRTLGCRVYFCAGREELQSELYETGLRRIRRLCQDSGREWEYGLVLKMLATEDVSDFREGG